MAQHNFIVDINLNRNQALNMILQNLSVHPTTSGLPIGFTYYNTTQNTPFTWNGTEWLDLGLSGITNLSLGTITTTTIPINNDTGTGVILPSATQSAAGLLSAADKTKLDSLTDGASVSSFSAGNLSPLFTTSVANPTTTPTLTFSLSSAAAHTWFGNNSGSASSPSFNAAGSLSKTDDTNVKLTFTGTPANSLLHNVGLHIDWDGILGINRGGTGLDDLGTAGQLLRVNAAETALEYFDPSFADGTVTSVGLTAPSSVFNITGSPVTSSGTLGLTFKSQTQKTFLAAPAGSNGVPSFRTITMPDLGTGTTNATTVLRGNGTWFQLINDNTTTTNSTWSSDKISQEIADALTGGMKYIGGYNASTNTPNLTSPAAGAVEQGYTYTVTTAGTFFGEDLEVGDLLIAEVDDPSSLDDWTRVQRNIPEIVHADQSTFGITRYATQAETNAGTADDLAISPLTLKNYLDNNNGKYVETIGDGSATSFTITHNLDDLDVTVEIYENSTGATWIMQVERTSANVVVVSANTPPANNQFRVIVRS